MNVVRVTGATKPDVDPMDALERMSVRKKVVN